MLEVELNKRIYRVERINDGEVSINGHNVQTDIKQISNNSYHLLLDQQSFVIEVVENASKAPVVKVNGVVMSALVKDETDILLERLGMNTKAKRAVSELRAPMPGLVRDIRVSVGDDVSEGAPLIVLEAMKMENVLKSPVSGRIKAIPTAIGKAIEKSTILIQFE